MRALLLWAVLTLFLCSAVLAERIGEPNRGPTRMTSLLLSALTLGEYQDDESDDEESEEEEEKEEEEKTEEELKKEEEERKKEEERKAKFDYLTRGRGSGVRSDFKAIWHFWWEHNKDRFLAEATMPPRVKRGSALFWFGAGPKFPPRHTDPVPAAVRGGLVLTALRRAVVDKDMVVRAEACIALGRIGSVPTKGGDAVTKELLGVLDRTLSRKRLPLLVRRSAIIGLGISGLPEGCARLMKIARDGEAEDRDYAILALGLARHKPAIPLLARMLPRTVKFDPKSHEIAAIHALGLFGPEPPEEDLLKHKIPMRLSKMAAPWGRTKLAAPAVTALARLRLGHKTVVKACTSKSMPIRWAGLLGLAGYTSPEAVADATQQLLGRHGMKSGDTQTQVYAMLAAGDLARHLDGTSKARKALLAPLRERLRSNHNLLASAAAVAVGVARDKAATGEIVSVMGQSKDDIVLGGCFLAVGLLGAHKQAPLLDAMAIEENRRAGHARGYGAVGLALTGDTTRVDHLIAFQKHAFADRYARRQSPLAIGVLGDKSEVEHLVELISKQRRRRDRVIASSAAYALGWIRDLRAVRPLAELATTHKHRNVRGMAVIALGYVAARDRHHPLQRLLENLNHRDDYGWKILKAIAGIL